MGRLTVRLPDALHRQLAGLADHEGVSLNQYLVYALTRQATLAAKVQAEHAFAPRPTGKTPRSKTPSTQSEGAMKEIRDLHAEALAPPAAR